MTLTFYRKIVDFSLNCINNVGICQNVLKMNKIDENGIKI